MPKPKLYIPGFMVRLSLDAAEKMDALRDHRETRAAFIRAAVEREIAARTKKRKF